MLLKTINGVAQGVVTDANLKNVVLAEMEAAAPILGVAQMYTFVGNADSVQPFAENAIGANRVLGTDFTGVQIAADAAVAVPLYLFGDSIRTDRAYQDRGLSIEGFHLTKLRKAANTLGRYFTDEFINGVGGAHITGLSSLIAAGETTVFDSADGGELPAGNAAAEKKQQSKFLETVEEVVNALKGTGSAWFMTGKLKSRIQTVLREYCTTAVTEDILGNKHIITSLMDVPIISTGYKANGTSLIQPSTETVGNSLAECNSMYLVKFGERSDTTFATTPVGLKVQTEQTTSNIISKIELQYNLCILEAKSALRLSGIIIPSI